MLATLCPACFSHIKVNKSPYEGQIMACGKCKATLEVIDTDPVELDIYVTKAKKQPKNFIRSKKDELDLWKDEDFGIRKSKRRKNTKRKRTTKVDYM